MKEPFCVPSPLPCAPEGPKVSPTWRPILVPCARHNPASCPPSSTLSRPTLVGGRRNLPFSKPFLSHQPYFPVAKVRHLCKGYMGCHIKIGAQSWQGTLSEVPGGHKHHKMYRDHSDPATCPRAETGSEFYFLFSKVGRKKC